MSEVQCQWCCIDNCCLDPVVPAIELVIIPEQSSSEQGLIAIFYNSEEKILEGEAYPCSSEGQYSYGEGMLCCICIKGRMQLVCPPVGHESGSGAGEDLSSHSQGLQICLCHSAQCYE